jgi:hypothetical protein
LSHTAVQSVQIAPFLGLADFRDTYICSLATKVITSHFRILSQQINHFYSIDSWKRNTYWSILMKQITGRNMIG